MATERHQGLDALKGFLIVAVIIGHFPTSGRGTNPFGPLPEWLYFFHVPLFLALSCLFAQPFTLRQAGHRARQLLAPFGLWMVLTHPHLLLTRPWALATDAAMGNWAHVQSILWFLPALFTANLLMACWRGSRVLTQALLLSAAIGAFVFAPRLALWHGRIPFGLDVALFLFPFIWIVDQAWRRRQALAQRAGPWLTPAAILALPLGGILVRYFEQVKTHSAYARRVDFAQFSVPETVAGYLGMTLMGVALVVLAVRLPAPRWLAAVGRFSMPIYLLHYPLLFALTRSIGLAGEGRLALLVYGLAVTALIVGIAMLTAQVLTRLSPRVGLLGLKA
jgi:fucose 4-O-acetylase-like acetyltransferase